MKRDIGNGAEPKSSPDISFFGGRFSFCLTTLEGRPLRVVITLVFSGEVCLRLLFLGTYRLSSDSEEGDDELGSLCLESTAEASVWACPPCEFSSLMGAAGRFSSALALNGVMWTASSQSKSNVSLNPREVLSLFPCDGGAVLARVADRSRLLERALGLGFSQGFFNAARSGLRPLSGFRAAGSGLVGGCCGWACFLLGRCWLFFLGGTGSGVEC